ncbi:rsbT co-antagonist protein RsbR [Gammaproteobacteria bacterium]
MPTFDFSSLSLFIVTYREEILQRWMRQVMIHWRRYGISEAELRQQTVRLLEAIRAAFAEGTAWEATPGQTVVTLLHALSAERAKASYSPTDTALYIFSLKSVLRELLEEQTEMSLLAFSQVLGQIDRVIDRLVMISFDAYTESRERIIAQQSLALLELSTPVVRLWDRILLLPLVGVIDTERARQITERLLEAIALYEATVAILDVTGVPIMDTSVAGHLIKTVAAARMLGAQIVMTGISPEGAQTLVKLGINFQDVITRATLRAGVAEGLRMLNKRVTTL